MAVLAYKRFGGIAPVYTKYRLPPQMAQQARNLDLSSRTGRPLRQPLTVSSGYAAGNPSSIYRFGQSLVSDTQYWFHWAGHDVDVVKGAIPSDTTERTYFTGVNYPQVTNNTLALTGGPPYPVDTYRLGVPSPTAAPTVTISGTGSGDVEARTYCYTYVTGWGEESAPSPASPPQDWQQGKTVTLSNLQTGPSGDYNVTAKRIYRSVSGSQATLFYFVKEVAANVTSTNDDVTYVGEPLKTSGWRPPPATAFGIMQMANGITILLDGYDVLPSVQYAPYAYPLGYQLSTDYKIVGGKAIGNQAVICTVGTPYMLSGASPDALALTKIEIAQGCVSKRSIVGPIHGGVMYASPDGLVLVGPNGDAQVVTRSLFTRDDWQAFNPESIHGYVWNNKYVGFYDTGSVQAGFIFDPTEGDAAFCHIDLYATGGYSDLLQDALYLKVGTNIVKFNAGGTYMTALWRSGVTMLNRAEKMACALVRAVAYPVTVRIYADGVLRHTATATDSSAMRLPSGYSAREWEIEVEGTKEWYEVLLASSMDELRAVV